MRKFRLWLVGFLYLILSVQSLKAAAQHEESIVLDSFQKKSFDISVLGEGYDPDLHVTFTITGGPKPHSIVISDNQVVLQAPVVYQSKLTSIEVSQGINNLIGVFEISILPNNERIYGWELSQNPELTDELETDYYASFGFPQAVLHRADLWSGKYCYPTIEQCYEGENEPFGITQPGFGVGDFNGDGHQDAFTIVGFTPRHLTVPLIKFMINDGAGKLIEKSGFMPDELAAVGPYRHAIADFNQDGSDDIVFCTKKTTLGDDYLYDNNVWTPHLLIMSSANGGMRDATDSIDYPSDNLKRAGCHDASSGDFNNDGWDDFFIGGIPFRNDGNGNFTAFSVGPNGYGGPMSSLMVDINRDGFDDFIWLLGDPLTDVSTEFDSGGFVLLSDGLGDPSSWSRQYLPHGYFGKDNSKMNHAVAGDLDGDGFPEIIVGGTRVDPYYYGRTIQILKNLGGTGFRDVTQDYLASQSRENPPLSGGGGEGMIFLDDWDGDGDLDIIDNYTPTNGALTPPGVSIFINRLDSHGDFVENEHVIFPAAISGYRLHASKPNDNQTHMPTRSGVPIDLDGKGLIDFLVGASSLRLPDTYTGAARAVYSLIAKESVYDLDNDGLLEPNDPDDDNDGVNDELDAFPRLASESADTDLDGIGNNSDLDDDADGILDSADSFPLDSEYSIDSDGDGMPDAWETRYGLDPNDPSDATSDQDNDGVSALDEFLAGTIPSGSLDIDGNEKYDALTDGLLLLRGMFGLDSSALVTGTIASDATYTESVDIESRIEMLGYLADIDGNGEIDALTDGLLTLRYLFGLQGDTLINGVVAGDATRKTAEEIEAHLETLMPSL